MFKVEEIRIAEGQEGGIDRFRVWIDDQELSLDERNALAWRDGFRGSGEKRAFEEMVRYWVMGNPGNAPLRFTGHIIHWLYNQDCAAAREVVTRKSSAPKASGPATGSRPQFASHPSGSSPINAQPSAGVLGACFCVATNDPNLGGTRFLPKVSARPATDRADLRSASKE